MLELLDTFLSRYELLSKACNFEIFFLLVAGLEVVEFKLYLLEELLLLPKSLFKQGIFLLELLAFLLELLVFLLGGEELLLGGDFLVFLLLY